MNPPIPIFLSGPHGGGKSTLIEKLTSSYNLFVENNFDIDFTVDFPSISTLSDFERSLLRLYHRFFIANHAQIPSKDNSGKFILTNRSIYDSEAYIASYDSLQWISKTEFQKLNSIMKSCHTMVDPHTIVLNPPIEVIKARLKKRRSQSTRTNRDQIFKNEDSDIFIEHLWNYFKKFKAKKNILYLEDNDNDSIKKIIQWVKMIKNKKL